MNKKMLNLLTAYSAFTGSCMNSVYHPSIISNSIKFEKTNIKGLSSEEMGTANSRKKKSRKERKREKRKNENRRNKTSYI